MTTKAILPFIGFGSIKFGMEEHEVSSNIGDPDETEVQNYGDGGSATVLYYDDLGLSMSFDSEEGYRLVEISFESDRFILHNAIKPGMSKEDFLEALEKLNMGEYEVEEIDEDGLEDMEQYIFDKENINIWFEEGRLTTIQIGPEFVDDDTIRWPKRATEDDE
nr:hypothetical protein [uncultured Carboxylicivirga sp.]